LKKTILYVKDKWKKETSDAKAITQHLLWVDQYAASSQATDG